MANQLRQKVGHYRAKERELNVGNSVFYETLIFGCRSHLVTRNNLEVH